MTSQPPPRSLEHPLPAGMRDLLPEEASDRRALARRLLERFAMHGYAVVTPPVFEFADVLERGLGTLDPADVLRFIEPESGGVAALRPDMTPQIARMIATRLRGRPAPFRLAYEGTVLRRRSGLARKRRQIAQVGVELAGTPGAEGDFELVSLAVDALKAAGLAAFTVDLADAGVVRALLANLASADQDAISNALMRKDPEDLRAACEAARTPYAEVLGRLASLHGNREVLAAGTELLARTPAAGASKRLLALFDASVARGLGAHVTADLGEVRGFAYYTGTIFHLYAPGTGDAVGSGGRYDELLARFGWDLPAAGFGLDLDRLGEALRAASAVDVRPVRVVVVGAADDSRVRSLRAKGIAAVAIADRASALAWGRAWGFCYVLDASGWVDVASGASIASPVEDVDVQERGRR